MVVIVAPETASISTSTIKILDFSYKGRGLFVVQGYDLMDLGVFHDADAEYERSAIALSLLDQDVIAGTVALFPQMKNNRIVVDLGQLLALEFGPDHALVILAFRSHSNNKGNNQHNIRQVAKPNCQRLAKDRSSGWFFFS
jgi:hypothetical protein